MSEASLRFDRQHVGAFLKGACRKNAFKNTRIQWNAGTARVSEGMLKTLACIKSGGHSRRPAPLRNLSLPKKMGATEEMFRW